MKLALPGLSTFQGKPRLLRLIYQDENNLMGCVDMPIDDLSKMNSLNVKGLVRAVVYRVTHRAIDEKIYNEPCYEEVSHAEGILRERFKQIIPKAQKQSKKPEEPVPSQEVPKPEPPPITPEPKLLKSKKEKPSKEQINPASIQYNTERYNMPVMTKKDEILFPDGHEIDSSKLGQPARLFSHEVSTGHLKLKPLRNILESAREMGANFIVAKEINKKMGIYEFRCYTCPADKCGLINEWRIKKYGIEAMLTPQSQSP